MPLPHFGPDRGFCVDYLGVVDWHGRILCHIVLPVVGWGLLFAFDDLVRLDLGIGI